MEAALSNFNSYALLYKVKEFDKHKIILIISTIRITILETLFNARPEKKEISFFSGRAMLIG